MYIDAKTPLEAFNVIVKMLEAENKVLQEKANDIVPSVMEVGKYPQLHEYKVDTGYSSSSVTLSNTREWFIFKDYYGRAKEVSEITGEMISKRKEKLEEQIKHLDVATTDAEEKYAPAIENNKKIHEKIALMMKHIGVRDTYSTWEYKSSRSSKKTETTHYAGYKGDLSRNVPIAIQGVKPNIQQLTQSLTNEYNEIRKKIVVEQTKKAEEKRKAQEVHEIALLRAKYCPDNALADAEEILDALLAKNKYLHLGYYLQRNRGDWSEGYSFAETGLDGFTLDCAEDHDIYDDINSYIRSWQGDGRVFRDCEYNYNVLFSKEEDEQLMKDYEKLYSLVLEY